MKEQREDRNSESESEIESEEAGGGGGNPSRSPGFQRFCWFGGVLVLAYGWIFVALAKHAAQSSLHSHILLIPIVSAYLIRIDWKRLPSESRASLGWAGAFALAWGIALALALAFRTGEGALSRNDFLALAVFSFLCLLAAGGFFFLGRSWMRVLAFPFAFLLFMIPLPDAAVEGFEHLLMAASAEAVNGFFQLARIPYLRVGQVFQIPGITLEVAQECSGIRSSWVLLITSLLASYLFLKSPWKRALLVAVVIPLGILRNGFRVLVLAWLCVHYGPGMIDTPIHHRGGPIFFVLSLIPLFLLLWWLRRTEGDRESCRDQGNK